MASEAAEILATALEACASAQEQGTLGNLDKRLQSVRRQVVSINDIPRPTFRLAMRFWKDWVRASRQGWRFYGPVTENDWPDIARTIAQHVRTGTLPPDTLILDNFMRKRRNMLWRDLRNLFDDSA